MNNNKDDNTYEDLHKDIENGRKLDRLLLTPDFSDLLIEDYIHATLIEGSRDLISDDASVRAKCLEKLIAVNILREHLECITSSAESALNYEEE